MRKFLAIVVCKLGRFVGKLVGKGSSMPGKFALKICPDILKRVQLPPHIIAVTGSNGKTSTVEMIATVLRAQGKHVIYNAEGSNQVEGVTTLILTHATLGGRVNADVILSIMCEQKPNQKEKISFQSERLKPFIPKNFTAKQTEDYVIKALEYYHRYQLRQKERDR